MVGSPAVCFGADKVRVPVKLVDAIRYDDASGRVYKLPGIVDNQHRAHSHLSTSASTPRTAMFPAAALLALSFAAAAYGQQVGTLTAENHPRLSVQQCTSRNNCQTQQRSVVLDANWRWLHSTSGSNNCYTGNTWDASLCPDPSTLR